MRSIGWAILDKDDDLWRTGMGYNKEQATDEALEMECSHDVREHAPFRAVEVFVKED